jgi:hypothetical protein
MRWKDMHWELDHEDSVADARSLLDCGSMTRDDPEGFVGKWRPCVRACEAPALHGQLVAVLRELWDATQDTLDAERDWFRASVTFERSWEDSTTACLPPRTFAQVVRGPEREVADARDAGALHDALHAGVLHLPSLLGARGLAVKAFIERWTDDF